MLRKYSYVAVKVAWQSSLCGMYQRVIFGEKKHGVGDVDTVGQESGVDRRRKLELG